MENKDFISYKEKIAKLFKGIIYFLETYSKLMKKKKIDFKFTNFIERLKEFYNNLSANLKEKNVLDKALNFLKQYNFDIITFALSFVQTIGLSSNIIAFFDSKDKSFKNFDYIIIDLK